VYHDGQNPNNPDAGTLFYNHDMTCLTTVICIAWKFHELNQAYELLLDPLRRLALDAKLRIKEARKARFSTYDAKRKGLVEELEERERAFKKARMEKQKEEVDRWRETEKIKEEGRRLREERQNAIRTGDEEKERSAAENTREEMDVPSSGV
jgi:DnaJ family protein C protein 17